MLHSEQYLDTCSISAADVPQKKENIKSRHSGLSFSILWRRTIFLQESLICTEAAFNKGQTIHINTKSDDSFS